QRRKMRRTTTEQLSPPHQTVAINNLGYRALRRPSLVAPLVLKPPLQLLRTPGRMRRSQRYDRRFSRFIDRSRMVMRRTALVRKPAWPRRLIAISPLVPGLAAYTVLPAQ